MDEINDIEGDRLSITQDQMLDFANELISLQVRLKNAGMHETAHALLEAIYANGVEFTRIKTGRHSTAFRLVEEAEDGVDKQTTDHRSLDNG